MSRKEKLILKLKDHNGDFTWTLPEVEACLALFGFTLQRKRGSHRTYQSPDFAEIITLAPHGKAIKPAYIRMIRAILLS